MLDPKTMLTPENLSAVSSTFEHARAAYERGLASDPSANPDALAERVAEEASGLFIPLLQVIPLRYRVLIRGFLRVLDRALAE